MPLVRYKTLADTAQAGELTRAHPKLMGRRRGLRPRCVGLQGARLYMPGIVRKEMKMANTRLLQAVCTVAMLAAVPAFAQNSNTGTNAMPNAGAQQPAETGGGSNMAPAGNKMAPEGNAMGNNSAMGQGHTMHHSAMHRGSMHNQSANAQDEEVNRLNDESYQAAQRGQAFSIPGSNGAMMAPNGSGSGAHMMPQSNPPGAMNGYGAPGSQNTTTSTGASPTGSGANEPSAK